MPIFRVKSVKIYTGQKNLHEHVRGVRDKYQVCLTGMSVRPDFRINFLSRSSMLNINNIQVTEKNHSESTPLAQM